MVKKKSKLKLLIFFKEQLYSEYDARKYQLRKKRRLNKYLDKICYTDLTDIMPDRLQELAKRQLVQEYDQNIFKEPLFKNNGINCFATSMEMVGYLDRPRFVSQYEIDEFLLGPLCQKIDKSELQPGDILSYYPPQKRTHSPDEPLRYPVHTSIYLTEDLVFEKKGGHRTFPYQIARYSESLAISKGPVVAYRCKDKQGMLQETKQIQDFHSTLKGIEEVEACLNKIYSTEIDTPYMRDIERFVKMNLEVLEELVYSKVSDLRNPETLKPYVGKELEYEYWSLLKWRIISMNENFRRRLEFPNIYDYLNEV